MIYYYKLLLFLFSLIYKIIKKYDFIYYLKINIINII